jgi:hypothetical protein
VIRDARPVSDPESLEDSDSRSDVNDVSDSQCADATIVDTPQRRARRPEVLRVLEQR